MPRIITIGEVNEAAADVVSELVDTAAHSPIYLYGLPRGGVPAAYAVQGQVLRRFPNYKCEVVGHPGEATHLIDDVRDSGATIARYQAALNLPAYTLFTRNPGDPFLVFPWEGDHEHSAEDIGRRLLQFVGEDCLREGLKETPKRFAKAWQFWTHGYHTDPATVLKTFQDGAEGYNQMVLVKAIQVYSHCEHHLAPFFGEAHLAYIPDGRIVGLSKLARLVEVFSRRLQTQERLTQQIAAELDSQLKPKGVGVIIRCRHFCMESRGIQQRGTYTITSALRGALLEEGDARQEFLNLGLNGDPV